MINVRTLLLASAFVLATPFAAQPVMAMNATDTALDYTKIDDVAKALSTGQFTELHSHLNSKMAGAVSADQLKTLWEQITAQVGPLRKTEVKSPELAILHFEKAKLRLLLGNDASGQISGLLIQPDEDAAKVDPVPTVTAADPITEQPIEFNAPNAPKLVGTLTLPKNVKNPPAVVLIHGSGAHDRYETIFTNRPFLDISRGLAKQGIAVLSYDKRTLTHAKTIDITKLTLDQETTDDGAAAAKFLQTNKNVNGKRVFVLGHSQGGMVIPLILQRDAQIRGGIIFASPAGHLIDVLPHQNRTMLGDAVNTDAGKAHLKMIDDSIRTIRDPKADPKAIVLGQPVSYWKSIDAVNPALNAKQTKQPILVVQGGKDFQVIKQDWEGWEKHAKTKATPLTFKLYPELNHLGMKSLGKPGMEDYKDPRHVDPQLISDIAAWIKAQR